jgi:(p)ppGpp synthase/HD superfamily hydrolase
MKMGSLEHAIELAIVAHDGQKDKQGMPYILHPLAVMHSVLDEVGWHEPLLKAAVLHDVVEDSDIPIPQIYGTFGALVANIVESMTRRDHESYGRFIERLCLNSNARIIKTHDINHNLSRMAGLPESERRGLTNRYKKALKVIESYELLDV